MGNELLTKKSSCEREKSTPLPCKSLRFLYRTLPGRLILKPLTSRPVAKLSGAFLSSPLSRPLIKGFIRKNHIDLTRYEEGPFHSYNEFFTRRQKAGITSWESDPTVFSAPCDSRLSAYPIDESSLFSIKDSLYSIAELLDDSTLAERFSNGCCLIFRLSVDDYHRYSYVDDGAVTPVHHVKGLLHTVQPISAERCNIYKRNTREIALQKSEHFGTIAYIEVGAMLIGRIRNHRPHAHYAKRGEEKGYFEYGGSTVVLLLEKGKLLLDPEFFENTAAGFETKVRLGDILGKAAL